MLLGTSQEVMSCECGSGHIVEEDARAIRTAQEVFKDDELEGKLAYIKTNFGSLPSDIHRLQERGIALGNSIALLKDAQEKLDSVVGDIGEKV
ncbi:hypothetical protein C0J52_26289 [Blattella germanica]|nr:hypothetical protein C0J52_26289 [Blattella germanica]